MMAEKLVFGTYRLHRQPLIEALQQWKEVMMKTYHEESKGTKTWMVDSGLTYKNTKELVTWLAERKLDEPQWFLGTKVGLRSGDTVTDQITRLKEEISGAGWPLERTRILLHRQRPYEQYVEFARASLEAGFGVVGMCNVDAVTLGQLIDRLKQEHLEALMPQWVQIEVHPHVDCVDVIRQCASLGVRVEGHSLFRGGHTSPADRDLFNEMAATVRDACPSHPVWGHLSSHELLVAWALHHLQLDSLAVRSVNREHWARMMLVAQSSDFEALSKVFEALDQYSRHWGTFPGARIYKIRSQARRLQEAQEQEDGKFDPVKSLGLPADPCHLAVSLKAELEPSSQSDTLSVHAIALNRILPPRSPSQREYVIKLAQQALGNEKLHRINTRYQTQITKKVCSPAEAEERRINSLISTLSSELKALRIRVDARRHLRRQKAKGHCCVLKPQSRNPCDSEQIRRPEAMPVSPAPEKDVDIYMNLLSSGGNPETLGVLPWPAADHSGIETPHGTLFYTSLGGVRDGRSDFCKQSDSPVHFAKLCEAVRAGWRVPLPSPETLARWQAEGKAPVADGRVYHFLIGNNVSLGQSVGPLLDMIRDREVGLETLYIAGNRLCSSNLAQLCESLRDHPTMKALWLKRNPLCLSQCADDMTTRDLGGIRALGQLIAKPGLRVLDLDNCGLLSDGLVALIEGFESSLKDEGSEGSDLRHLYLNANGFNAEDAKILSSRLLSRLPKLRTLYLGINGLGVQGCLAVAQTCAQSHPHLRALSLASNAWNSNDPQDLRQFLDALAGISSLKSLDLGCYKSTRDLGCQPNFLGHTPGALSLIRHFLEHQVPRLEHLVIRRNSFNCLLDLLDLLAWANGLRTRQERHLSIEARQMEWPMKLNLSSHHKAYLRFVRHTRRVLHIDSIYRNRMKL